MTLLVSHEHHRRSLGEQERRHQVAPHAIPQRENFGIVRLALDTAIPAAVIVMPVVVVFAVRLVVLVVVGVDVRERESVMRSDEVHARPRATALPVELRRAAHESGRDRRQRAFVAAPKRSRIVAKAIVPLRPARRKIADLIAILAQVPRLGDQLRAGQHRILPQHRKKRAVDAERTILARHRAREIEAEAVDPELLDPVTQRIRHELQHARMIEVERVAATGAVEIKSRIVRELVIDRVVDAAKR